jgi:photosystem II stability/assembly factor-like uncharacterized protein
MAGKGSTIIAAGNSGAIRSADGGKTWARTGNDTTGRTIYGLTESDGKFFAAGYGKVYVSSDDGVRWTETAVPDTGETHLLTALAAHGSDVFVGSPAGLFVSRNGGLSWSKAGDAKTDTLIWSLFVHGTDVFAGTLKGAFISRDLGVTWRDLPPGLPDKSFVESFAVRGENLFASVSGLGVWKIPLTAVSGIREGNRQVMSKRAWVRVGMKDGAWLLEVDRGGAGNGRSGIYDAAGKSAISHKGGKIGHP